MIVRTSVDPTGKIHVRIDAPRMYDDAAVRIIARVAADTESRVLARQVGGLRRVTAVNHGDSTEYFFIETA